MKMQDRCDSGKTHMKTACVMLIVIVKLSSQACALRLLSAESSSEVSVRLVKGPDPILNLTYAHTLNKVLDEHIISSRRNGELKTKNEMES